MECLPYLSTHTGIASKSTSILKGDLIEGGTLSMKSSISAREKSASKMTNEKIKKMGDWREKTLAKVRQLIKELDPENR